MNTCLDHSCLRRASLRGRRCGSLPSVRVVRDVAVVRLSCRWLPARGPGAVFSGRAGGAADSVRYGQGENCGEVGGEFVGPGARSGYADSASPLTIIRVGAGLTSPRSKASLSRPQPLLRQRPQRLDERVRRGGDGLADRGREVRRDQPDHHSGRQLGEAVLGLDGVAGHHDDPDDHDDDDEAGVHDRQCPARDSGDLR